ncbi:MAG: hypothetical protein HUN04_01535 [Desulfobacter sp.]|nr:MAG: hypothetical protein HUN04_01535 [Desulfobacter sp.]
MNSQSIPFCDRVLIPFSMPAVTLVLICLFFTNNLLLAPVLAMIFIAGLIHRKSRFKSALGLFALIFGTWGEYICCKYALWIYANPTVLGLPGWLPFVWPILLVNMWEISEYLTQRAMDMPGFLKASALVGALAVIGGYVGVTVYLLQNIVIAVICGFGMMALVLARRPVNLVLFVVVGAAGTFGEFVCVLNHVWYYTNPTLKGLGMPVSLPLAWGVSANFVWCMATLAGKFRSAVNGGLKAAP